MKAIQSYFTVKPIGPLKYYLGNDYMLNKDSNIWTIGCTTYVKEALSRVESFFYLKRWATPLPSGDCHHHELDTNPLLNAKGRTQFQTLLGMLQWLVSIGRLDLSFATASLSRFGGSPCELDLNLALHVFGYLKFHPDYRITLNSVPMNFSQTSISSEVGPLQPNFLQD